MMLFVKSATPAVSQIAIPLNRIYDIWSAGCRVNISYDSGELIEVEGTYQKKIETVSAVFNSEDTVNKVFRQFYKACNNNAGAFFIGEN